MEDNKAYVALRVTLPVVDEFRPLAMKKTLDCSNIYGRTNFCPSWNNQKRLGSLIISGRIEVNVFASIRLILEAIFGFRA